MTGPDHYREAEKLLAAANRKVSADDSEWLHPAPRRAELRAEAAIHATLSLAAATALGNEGEARTMPSQDRAAWFDAAAECRKAAAE